jgi:hypothetical protein
MGSILVIHLAVCMIGGKKMHNSFALSHLQPCSTFDYTNIGVNVLDHVLQYLGEKKSNVNIIKYVSVVHMHERVTSSKLHLPSTIIFFAWPVCMSRWRCLHCATVPTAMQNAYTYPFVCSGGLSLTSSIPAQSAWKRKSDRKECSPKKDYVFFW